MRARQGLGKRVRAASAVLAGLAVCVGPAAAQYTDNAWMQALGPGYSGGSDITDREFIREWEKNPRKGLPTLSPANIGPMKAAIARYTAIAAKGGWRRIPDVKLQQGATHSAVALVRQRLHLSGELTDSGTSDYFDYDLDQAVRRYQEANGLAPTGVLDKGTIAAMNVPATSRLKQLQANLARLGEVGKTPR